MKESFLHYIWKFKKFQWANIETTDQKEIVLMQVGTHNEDQSGPDFFNAKMKIGEQTWAGNVEIHLKASDWYVHRHETDPAYDNVILHVVWENDAPIYRKNNSPVPTLELKELVPIEILHNYHHLMGAKSDKWINCENDFSKFGDFEMNNWLDRMYLERLENKSQLIIELLQRSKNNWEEVLFKMLAKNFGLNVNGEAFLQMAHSIPFHIVQKLAHRQPSLEALFFGQAGMLDGISEEKYFQKLQNEHLFLSKKFGLDAQKIFPVNYFRLRPDNFPSVRLAQLAALYSKRKQLFSKVIACENKKGFYELFGIEPANFWQTHYTFEKQSKKKNKKPSLNFIDLLLINTIVPIKFCFAKFQGNLNEDKIFSLIKSLKPESNRIISKYDQLRGKKSEDAFQTQALLHLKKNYCDKNACLQCALGTKLLQGI